MPQRMQIVMSGRERIGAGTPRLGILLTAFAWLLAATSCGPSSGASHAPASTGGSGAGYSIVATTGMVADIARAVAGDRAKVTGLMGAGVDPHLYKPTRNDVQRILGADVVLYNGLMLEGRLIDSLERASRAGRAVHAVAGALPDDRLLAPDGFAGHADPHVWMDPELWAQVVDSVEAALIDHDPEGEAEYRDRAAAYRAQIEQVDAYAQEVLHSVPERERVLITAHDAFNYFGRRYGYEVVGVQGLSTDSEASVHDVERLVSLLVDRGVRAVFVESSVSPRNVEALIAGARARGHTVVVGGNLFSDAMGPVDTYEGTYIGMIDHNVTTIARALGGEAPESGMQGRLAP